MRLAISLLLLLPCAIAQEDWYASALYKALRSGNLQSISAAVVVDGKLRYVTAKGYANRWAGQRATIDTLYPFDSLTHTLTAASVVKLSSEGKFGLDDPIEKHLGGLTVKAQDPSAPITIRHVLAHTAGLVDSRESLEMHMGAIPALPTALLLSNSLIALSRPGTEVRYSHAGYAALGLLITGKVGQPLPEYIRETWLTPLGMSSTSFNLSGPLQERLAVGYTRPAEGEPVALRSFYHSPNSPLLASTGLCGTANDLAKWLLVHLNKGTGASRQLIPSSVFTELHKAQFPHLTATSMPQKLFSPRTSLGMGWAVWPCGTDRCFGQIGGSPGYTAVVMGNLDRRSGVVVLTNGDSAEQIVVALAADLMRMADASAVSVSEARVQ